jgi:hypothetical protein
MADVMRFITSAFGENSVLKKYVLKVSKFFLKGVLLPFSFFMNYFIAKEQTLLLTLMQLQS